jgi:hypothetical protein
MNMILQRLSEAPESQIDPSICVRLAKLAENPSSTEMKAILDDCVAYGLASDFAVAAMGIVYEDLKDAEDA